MDRPDHNFTHRWHVAINRFCWPKAGDPPVVRSGDNHWMYEAKNAADEVPRLTRLFMMERTDALPKIHRQCSHAAPEPVIDNVLTCCLGVKCAACPELQAIGTMEGTPEEIDTAKAWTCVAHVLSKGGDFAGEGYILTTDDRMYWENVYRSLSGSDDPPSEDAVGQ